MKQDWGLCVRDHLVVEVWGLHAALSCSRSYKAQNALGLLTKAICLTGSQTDLRILRKLVGALNVLMHAAHILMMLLDEALDLQLFRSILADRHRHVGCSLQIKA